MQYLHSCYAYALRLLRLCIQALQGFANPHNSNKTYNIYTDYCRKGHFHAGIAELVYRI